MIIWEYQGQYRIISIGVVLRTEGDEDVAEAIYKERKQASFENGGAWGPLVRTLGESPTEYWEDSARPTEEDPSACGLV